jgi:hypothetical protein
MDLAARARLRVIESPDHVHDVQHVAVGAALEIRRLSRGARCGGSPLTSDGIAWPGRRHQSFLKNVRN